MKSTIFSIALVVITTVHFISVLEARKSRQRLVAIAERWQAAANGAVATAENAMRAAQLWEKNSNEWENLATNCIAKLK